jgi:PAS domain S-box-containing protein
MALQKPYNENSGNKGYNTGPGIDNDNLKTLDCNNKFELLLESSLVAYFAVSVDCFIEDINPAFAPLLGYSTDELFGKSLDIIITEQDISNLKKTLSTLKSGNISVTYPLICKNGEIIHAQLSGKTFACSGAGILRFYFVFTDVTEKVLSHERLIRQNQNLKLKDELISSKELELKKQNLELNRLNKELKEKNNNIEALLNRIIENEMRLKLAFNAVNDGIWDWDLVKDEIFFSDRFFTMLGYGPFEFAQNFDIWKILLHPDDAKKSIEQLTSISRGIIEEFTLEYRMRTKEENYLWILSRGKLVGRDNQNQPLKILGTHVDITQHKQNEIVLKQNESELKKQNEEYIEINKKLEKSNRKISQINQHIQDKQAHLDSIFKTVPACIALISDSIILFVNDYAVLMTGYDIDEIIGHSSSFLYPALEEYNRVQQALYSNNSEGITKSTSARWKMKNGTLIDVYITVTRIDFDQATSGYSVSAIDITDQRLYEEELIKAKDQAEKAEKLKTVFLSNMSHELRTPMNGIVGFAEMLQSQVNQTKKEQYLKIIVSSSKQLLKIITDIIDISKIESGEVETFESEVSVINLLKDLHETYLNYLASHKKTNISIDIKYNLQNKQNKILIDENKLRQVLINLLNNAVKFTDIGNIGFGCSIEDNLIKFFVSDTGIGIDPEEKEIMFECFRQTESPVRKKYGGNGLGLAISKGFIKAMKGEIWVESKKDEGSTFYFTVPYHPISNEIAESQELYFPVVNWNTRHILIVDDDVTCLSLLDEMLEDTGIQISHAVTGLEAVKHCRKDLTIDIVLMDMRLPEMDGYEATRRIKENRPELAIIAQTAHALSEDRKKCLTAGCNNYITKPINQDTLFDMVSIYLKS